ncbi:uncharacterized protein A4U43_C08F22770 [Asparagus officinalis]|nr:uncharacterized protein A4U43_C08F22770 [Asparagus officinalis]
MPKLMMLLASDREETKELKGKLLEDCFLEDVAFFGFVTFRRFVEGLKGDHVYFVDSGLRRDKLDVGIYSLKRGTTKMITIDVVADIHTQPA